MIRKLYDWVLGLAESRYAVPALAAVSFAESSFFPIPPDIMLIPMILAAPHRAFFFAMVATVSSVIGGFFGYAIGYFAFDAVGVPVLNFYGAMGKYAELQHLYEEWGAWLIIIKGATPIPYKLVTIASGAFHFDLLTFAISSVISRGIRFFLVAALLWKFGPPIRDFIEKRLSLVFSAFMVLLVGGFFALRYI